MNKFLSKLFENLLSLPFGIAIIFLAIFSAIYYDYIEVAFFLLIGGIMIWSLFKKN